MTLSKKEGEMPNYNDDIVAFPYCIEDGQISIQHVENKFN